MVAFILSLFTLFLSIYILICRYLRFRRVRSILLTYYHAELDYRIAQDIVLQSAAFDMPYMITIALSFALFRTYGIPSIAHLLVQTNQLAHLDTAGRRAEDTVVLLNECLLHKLDSSRARLSLARINYLHSLYKNRISNDDMLYTLSLFVLEPIRWVKIYEWRALSSIEEQARLVYFKELGIRMGIENIPLTLIELETWANAYEEKHMIYSKDSQICGETTFALMLAQFPKCMESIIRKALLSLVDERLRVSMGFKQASKAMTSLTRCLLNIRAFLLHYCALPRMYPDDYGHGPLSCPLNQYGKYQRTKYLFQPWYVKATWWNTIFSLAREKPDLKYQCHGFKVEELGPEKLAGKGIGVMKKDVEKMKDRAM